MLYELDKQFNLTISLIFIRKIIFTNKIVTEINKKNRKNRKIEKLIKKHKHCVAILVIFCFRFMEVITISLFSSS